MKKKIALLIALLALLVSVAAFGVSLEQPGEVPAQTSLSATPTPASTSTPLPKAETTTAASASAEPKPVTSPSEVWPNYLGKVFASPDDEYMDMGEVVIQDFDAFFAFLDQLPNLKSVDMYATKVRKGRIEELALRYPNVHFGMTMQLSEHTIRTDQTAFSTLHYNTSAPHKSEDFSILKYCDNLLALDIGHNDVKDLSFLYDLPKLRVLIIACNAVTDITPLASLKDLEYAELFKNKITDLTPLSGLTHLIDLNIAFNNISDYTPIYGLHQVQRLWLYCSNSYSFSRHIPDEVLTALREAMPDAEIDSTHFSTAGTWREHPRYQIIKQMFKTGTYIPFEESFPLDE